MRFVLTLLATVAAASAQVHTFSGEHIRADVKFLSSDLLEGRGVGSRGGQLATEYIAAQFAIAGAKPAGDNGTYFQRVPLVGVETLPGATLSAARGSESVDFNWLNDFVGSNERQAETDNFDAEAVFVGHGIVAPEFGWNDFKDAVVRGKIVVLFTNEPPSTDPNFFGGRALTYYGRWTYKYEEALRHGALGAIIVHTTPTAGYGWDVVRNSWGREQSYVQVAPGAPALAFAGWVTEDAGNRLLGLSGHTVGELLNASNSRDFRPIPLGIHIRGSLRSKVREQNARNVVAIVPGSDPELRNEAVVFSAHWDHLGIGRPVNGDSIYNGAVDNATGCAMLIDIARAWAALEQKPKRSAIFVAVTAEETGLQGSEYFATHSPVPPGKLAADLNLDGFYPYGKNADVVLTGAERTSVWPLIQADARRFNLRIDPDPEPEQGHYYRSDHFSFARVGVPAFSVRQGGEFLGKPAGWGQSAVREYDEKRYHQPSDEYSDSWDVSGLEQLARFTMTLGIDTANVDRLPTWNRGDEFLPAREKSGVRQ